MANEYVTKEELKATLELSGQTFADSDVELAITSASRMIDQACGRRFYPDADATQVRYYSPASPGYVLIDDLLTLTSLVSDPDGDYDYDDTWTRDTDFLLEPLNAAADGRPWEAIRLMRSGGYSGFTTMYPRTIKVTGKFGWDAAPPAIKQATGILAAKLLRRAREAPLGIVTVGLEAGAAMRISRTDPDVALLIGPYIRTGVPFV